MRLIHVSSFLSNCSRLQVLSSLQEISKEMGDNAAACEYTNSDFKCLNGFALVKDENNCPIGCSPKPGQLAYLLTLL